MSFSTIGDGGSRQDPSDAARFPRVLPLKSKFKSSFIRGQNFSLEKQTVFALSCVYIENTHVCIHYWRRREPPGSLRCGAFSSGFTTKVKIQVVIYKGPKFFTGKTNGFSTFVCLSLTLQPRLHRKHTCLFPLLATAGAASIPQMRRVFLGFYH